MRLLFLETFNQTECGGRSRLSYCIVCTDYKTECGGRTRLNYCIVCTDYKLVIYVSVDTFYQISIYM